MKNINKNTLEELGFLPYNKSDYEFVHCSEEYAYNLKDNSVWAFCEVDGMYERLTVITKVSELKDFLEIHCQYGTEV